MLGDGNPQFCITVDVDGERAHYQPLHDPFVRHTCTIKFSAWGLIKLLFKPRPTVIQFTIDATPGAQRAVMMLDPVSLENETAEILEQRQKARNSSIGGCFSSNSVQ